MLVSIYPNINQTTDGTDLDIGAVLAGIRSGQWREQVELVRRCETKTEQREAKKRVPYFTVSGTFSKRSDAGLKEHSGLIALDIDADKNPDVDLKAKRRLIETDLFTFACFTSVSGVGFCVIVAIPAEHHEASFRALQRFYQDTYGLVIDSLPDVSRPRFVSYDPDLCYRPDAPTFEETLEEIKPVPQPVLYEPAPRTDFGQVVMSRALKMVFDAPDGTKHGALRDAAYLLGGYVGSGYVDEQEAFESLYQAISSRPNVADLKQAEATIRSGLRKGAEKPLLPTTQQRIVRQRQREGLSREGILASLSTCEGIRAERLSQAVDAVLQEPNPTLLTFWRIVYKEGKRASEDTYKLLVDRNKLREWLGSEGFSFRAAGPGNVEFLHVQENIVRLIERHALKQHVLRYVEQLPPRFDNVERDDLLEMLLVQGRPLFDKEALEFLTPLGGSFLQDEEKVARFFFRNTWVEVTAAHIRCVPYAELPGLIWQSQVRPHDFFLLPLSTAQVCDFHSFTVNVTGNDSIRLDALQRALGYLLHGYKDDAQARAVVLVDQVAKAGQPAGGTGKSLLMRAVGELVKVTQLSGATFRFDDDFRFALVEDATRILYFDEWDGRRLPFKKLFTEITSDMVVNRKNKPQVVIPFTHSPKFAITTNDMVSGQGSSHERRKVEIALAPHYSDSRTPKDEFGTGFFNQGWDEDEYVRFFNLALSWVQRYLAEGLLLLESPDIEARKVEQDTSPEFVEFAQAVLAWEPNLLDDKLWAADLYEQFISETGESRARLTLRHFIKWMERYGFMKVRSTQRGERRNQFYFLKPT